MPTNKNYRTSCKVANHKLARSWTCPKATCNLKVSNDKQKHSVRSLLETLVNSMSYLPSVSHSDHIETTRAWRLMSCMSLRKTRFLRWRVTKTTLAWPAWSRRAIYNSIRWAIALALTGDQNALIGMNGNLLAHELSEPERHPWYADETYNDPSPSNTWCKRTRFAVESLD